MAEPFVIAQGPTPLSFIPKMANRHGLIAGATGTGKTVTLQSLAEHFSALGVPVFLSDIKGDLSGLAKPGGAHAKIAAIVRELGFGEDFFQGFPVTFWDVFGQSGHPIRATISEMGPLLLARLLNLNETQEGVLQLAFKIADENGLLLLDLKDLRAVLLFVGENASQLSSQYGLISTASVGAIQRNLLVLEQQGGDQFFGEPAVNLADFLQTDPSGRGQINLLAADALMNNPRAYAAMLLWLLSELFEQLPEVGDLDKPKLVFFFDEAHLLFADLPRALEDKVEQVVRLIRSKGVGVYFITQNPLDLPEKILGQLGNRIQHALRAFTPRDQKAVRAAAETFRQNPKIDVQAAITELAVGEALVSLLDEQGTPGIVERARINPPRSQIGPITPAERRSVIESSLVFGTYEKTIDRESAAELLAARAQSATVPAGGKPGTPSTAPASTTGSIGETLSGMILGTTGPRGGRHPGLLEKMASGTVRSMGSAVGREIIRGVLGSLFGGGKSRR